MSPATDAERQVTAGDRRAARRRVAALVLGGTTLLSLQGGLLRVALPVIRRDWGAASAGPRR